MNASLTVWALIAGVSLSAAAQEATLLVSPAGRADFSANGRPVFSLVPGLYGDGWRGASAGMAVDSEDGVRRSTIRVPDGPLVDSELRVAGTAGRPLSGTRPKAPGT